MQRYAEKMKQYLKEHQPEKYQRLMKAGDLEEYCRLRGQAAQEQKEMLMQSGRMRDYEAEEVVIRHLFEE